jgi:tetratricopeptide (TPR) repeat protein
MVPCRATRYDLPHGVASTSRSSPYQAAAGQPMTPTSRRSVACAVVAFVVTSGTASGQSALVDELKTVSTQYHKDPSALDRIRDGLEQALRTDSHVLNLIALAQVSFLWGDIRGTTREQRLAAYDRGRQVGKRAVELAPKSPAAHFWYATNAARWGQLTGVVRSLALLPTVKEELDIVLELDPRFTAAYVVSGNVFYEVPGLLGGDLKRAEELFRKALAQDSKFTAARIGLAKTLIKTGRADEARRELQAVLNEKNPRSQADWTMKDAKDARTLLESLKRD